MKNSRMGPFAALIYGINARIFTLIKHIVHRARPVYVGLDVISRPDYSTSLALPPAPSMSFPSGHTVTAFMMATILAQQHRKYRALFHSIACLVGFSRVYLGFHYPSDVVVGALLGYGVTKPVVSSMSTRPGILKEGSGCGSNE